MNVERIIRWLILIPATISFVRGDVLWGIASLFSLFLTFVPSLLKKEFRIALPIEIELLMFVALLLHLYGGALELYINYDWDSLTHLLSAAFVAIVGFVIVTIINEYAESIELSRAMVVLFVVLFTLAVGVVWEIGEFLSDRILGTVTQYSYDDTISDLIYDLVGAVIAAIIAPIYLKHNVVRIDDDLMGRLKGSNIRTRLYMVPVVFTIFSLYFLFDGSWVSLALSTTFLFLSFLPIYWRVPQFFEILMLAVLSIRFFEGFFGLNLFSFPVAITMVAFFISYLIYLGMGSNTTVLSMILPINALALSAIAEIFLSMSLAGGTNDATMMTFIYTLLTALIVVFSLRLTQTWLKRREAISRR